MSWRSTRRTVTTKAKANRRYSRTPGILADRREVNDSKDVVGDGGVREGAR